MKRTLIAILGLSSLGFLAIPAQADSLNISLNLGDPGFMIPVEHVHYESRPQVVIVRHDHDDDDYDYDFRRDRGRHYGYERRWHDEHHHHFRREGGYRDSWRAHHDDHGAYRRSEVHVYEPAPVIRRVEMNPKLHR